MAELKSYSFFEILESFQEKFNFMDFMNSIMNHFRINATNAVHNAEFYFFCDVVFEVSLIKSVFIKVETSGLKNNSLLGA